MPKRLNPEQKFEIARAAYLKELEALRRKYEKTFNSILAEYSSSRNRIAR